MWRSPWRDTTADDWPRTAVIQFETYTHGENASVVVFFFCQAFKAHVVGTNLSRGQYRAWHTHTIIAATQLLAKSLSNAL